MVMGKFSFKRPKKTVIIVVMAVIICALVAAMLFALLGNKKPDKPSNRANKALTSFVADKDTCNKYLKQLEDTDTSKLVHTDAFLILNYRGNCYFQLGQYGKSLNAFREMEAECNKAKDIKCEGSAKDWIDTVQYAIDHPATKPIKHNLNPPTEGPDAQ